jgi:hypothetical protein
MTGNVGDVLKILTKSDFGFGRVQWEEIEGKPPIPDTQPVYYGGGGGGGGAVTFREGDGDPEIEDVSVIVVPAGKLSDDGDGQVTLDFGGGSLDELSDVTLSSPAAGQVLYYDGSTWVNCTGMTVDGNTLTVQPGSNGLVTLAVKTSSGTTLLSVDTQNEKIEMAGDLHVTGTVYAESLRSVK